MKQGKYEKFGFNRQATDVQRDTKYLLDFKREESLNNKQTDTNR